MASTINSTGTSSGVVTTADASGILNLQGGGNTGISISATGVPTVTTPTISGTATFGSAALSSPSGSAPLAMARAWVYFNGSSGAVTASLNVSSVTVNSAGQYTVNLTTAAPSANYAKIASGYGGPGLFTGVDWNAATTSSFSVYCANTLTQAYKSGNPVNAVAYW